MIGVLRHPRLGAALGAGGGDAIGGRAWRFLPIPFSRPCFNYGEFTPRDVHMASLSLMAYAMGLVGFMLIKVLAPGYFARQDTRTPVRRQVLSRCWRI